MKVRIEVAITKATTTREMEDWHNDFKDRHREGEGMYDYLDFGPMTLHQNAIDQLSDLIDFIRGPAIVHVSFIDERKEGKTIEKVGG